MICVYTIYVNGGYMRLIEVIYSCSCGAFCNYYKPENTFDIDISLLGRCADCTYKDDELINEFKQRAIGKYNC